MAGTNLQYAHMNDADAFAGLLTAPISFNLSGGNVLVSGVALKSIQCYRLWFVVGGATNLTFQDGPNTNLSGAVPFLAYASKTFDISNVPWLQTSAGNDLILNSTNAVQVSGMIYYQQGNA